MELKHESITLSCLVRRALNPTCSILICFSREGGGVLAPAFLRSLYRRVQGILRSLLAISGLSLGDNQIQYKTLRESLLEGNFFSKKTYLCDRTLKNRFILYTKLNGV